MYSGLLKTIYNIHTYSTLRGVGTGVRFDDASLLSDSSSESLPNGFVDFLKNNRNTHLCKNSHKIAIL